MIGIVAISIDTIVSESFDEQVRETNQMVTNYVRWAARLLDIEALEASQRIAAWARNRPRATYASLRNNWLEWIYTFKMLSCLYQIHLTFHDGGSVTQRCIHYKTFSRLANDVKYYTDSMTKIISKFHCINYLIQYNYENEISKISCRRFRVKIARHNVSNSFCPFLEESSVHYCRFNYSAVLSISSFLCEKDGSWKLSRDSFPLN